MGCGARFLITLAAIFVLLGVPATAQSEGWRPEVDVETDAHWLTRLDSRLAPIHVVITDTLASMGASGTDAEVDAYVVIIQASAAKGIGILDSMEPARLCARDYAALERTMFLMWGDSADSFRQFRAGSTQAQAEVAALVPAAAYILTDYGDRIRLSAVCEAPEPVAIPSPTTAPERTATPAATPSAT